MTSKQIAVRKTEFLTVRSAQPTALERKSVLLTALESVRGDQTWNYDIPQVQRTPGLYPQCFPPLTYANGAVHQSNRAGHHSSILHILHKAKHSVIDNIHCLQTLCHHESIQYEIYILHSIYDLADLLSKNTTINAVINYKQNFKFRSFF